MNESHSFTLSPRRRLPDRKLWLLSLIAISAIGCGESETLSRAPVNGTVFSSGKALKSGLVRFVPIGETQGPVTVAPVTDGFYALDVEQGPVVGTHRVEVVATDYLGFDPGDQEAAERALKANKGKLPPNPVPNGYGKQSPLRAEVPPEGAEGLNFLLTASKPTSSAP